MNLCGDVFLHLLTILNPDTRVTYSTYSVAQKRYPAKDAEDAIQERSLATTRVCALPNEIERTGTFETGIHSKFENWHLQMLDFAPGLSKNKAVDFSNKHNLTLFKTENSWHGYGKLVSWAEYREWLYDVLIAKEYGDSAWIGFTLKRGRAVLRITKNHKGDIRKIDLT